MNPIPSVNELVLQSVTELVNDGQIFGPKRRRVYLEQFVRTAERNNVSSQSEDSNVRFHAIVERQDDQVQDQQLEINATQASQIQEARVPSDLHVSGLGEQSLPKQMEIQEPDRLATETRQETISHESINFKLQEPDLVVGKLENCGPLVSKLGEQLPPDASQVDPANINDGQFIGKDATSDAEGHQPNKIQTHTETITEAVVAGVPVESKSQEQSPLKPMQNQDPENSEIQAVKNVGDFETTERVLDQQKSIQHARPNVIPTNQDDMKFNETPAPTAVTSPDRTTESLTNPEQCVVAVGESKSQVAEAESPPWYLDISTSESESSSSESESTSSDSDYIPEHYAPNCGSYEGESLIRRELSRIEKHQWLKKLRQSDDTLLEKHELKIGSETVAVSVRAKRDIRCGEFIAELEGVPLDHQEAVDLLQQGIPDITSCIVKLPPGSRHVIMDRSYVKRKLNSMIPRGDVTEANCLVMQLKITEQISRYCFYAGKQIAKDEQIVYYEG